MNVLEEIGMNMYDMVMSGNSDPKIRFTDFRNLLLSYGFCV